MKIYFYFALFVMHSFSFSNAQNKIEEIQAFDIYIQTFYFQNQSQFYFNTELKQLLLISDIYSEKSLELKEYTIHDSILFNLNFENGKYHYVLATYWLFDKNKKRFNEEKHIILKDKNKLINKKWHELKPEDIREKHMYTYNYGCGNETFENIIYSDFVGNENSFIIKKNEKDYNLITFTSDCVSSDEDLFLDQPLFYYKEQDFFTCFCNGNSYVFIYGDIIKD